MININSVDLHQVTLNDQHIGRMKLPKKHLPVASMYDNTGAITANSPVVPTKVYYLSKPPVATDWKKFMEEHGYLDGSKVTGPIPETIIDDIFFQHSWQSYFAKRRKDGPFDYKLTDKPALDISPTKLYCSSSLEMGEILDKIKESANGLDPDARGERIYAMLKELFDSGVMLVPKARYPESVGKTDPVDHIIEFTGVVGYDTPEARELANKIRLRTFGKDTPVLTTIDSLGGHKLLKDAEAAIPPHDPLSVAIAEWNTDVIHTTEVDPDREQKLKDLYAKVKSLTKDMDFVLVKNENGTISMVKNDENLKLVPTGDFPIEANPTGKGLIQLVGRHRRICYTPEYLDALNTVLETEPMESNPGIKGDGRRKMREGKNRSWPEAKTRKGRN